MPKTPQDILADPDFHLLDPHERIRVMNTVDPDFLALPDEEKMKVVTAPTGPAPVQYTAAQKAALKREGIPENPSPTWLEGQKQVLAHKMEQAQKPAESTVGSRTREAAYGILNPFTAENVLSTVKTLGKTAVDLYTRPADPNSYAELGQVVKGAVQAPLQPIADIREGMRTGDYDLAARGAGGFLSQTVPAVEQVGSLVKKVPSIVKASDTLRKGAQNLTSTSAFKTTEPAVTKFNEAAADVAKRQAESDAIVAEKNRTAQEAAAKKTVENTQKTTARNEAAMNEADIATEQARAATEATNKRLTEAHAQKVAETTAHNENVLATQNRMRVLDSNLREGSQQLGSDLVDLRNKLRAEDNLHYDQIAEKVAGDEGVPLSEMAEAAKKAQQYLQGSAESIKQFNELIRKGAEDEGAIVNGMPVKAGDPLYDMLKSQGALDTGGNISFKDLKGYSSEIGIKLAKGGLPGDIYQALKALKESIDEAKFKIAERNGVEPELRQAEKFHAAFKDAFYNKDSAVAQAHDRVGVLDPQFYAEPFTKGKAAGVGVEKLKTIPSQYTELIGQITDRVGRLKSYYDELKATKAGTEKPMPAAPELKTQGPRAMATLEAEPAPVTPKVTPNKTIPAPEAPTAEGIVAEKRARVEAKGRNLAEISKYDAGTLASAPIGVALGHPVLGLVPLASKYGLSFLLTRPSVIEWIARPTAADLAAIEKLPEPVKVQVRTGLQQIMDQQAAAGKPVKPAGAVQNFLNKTSIVNRGVAPVANVNAGVRNRREAMEALQQAVP